MGELRRLVGQPVEKLLEGLRKEVVEVFSELQSKSGKPLDEWRNKLLLLIKSSHEASQQRFDDAELRSFMSKITIQKESRPPTYKRMEIKIPAEVELNVSDEIVRTKLSTLKKITGSIVDEIVSGKHFTAVDDAGRIAIAADPEVFKAALKYVESDRTWLPSAKKGSKVHRDLVETEIRKWRLDKGLARPSVLQTDIAKEFQDKVLNQEPPLQPGADNRALKFWRERGPYKLSDMCLHAMVPIDFENGKYRIDCQKGTDFRIQ